MPATRHVATDTHALFLTGGMVLSGLGAGLNELIALAGTAELVPVRKRGTYVGLVVFTILPFCPSVLWAQLIAEASNWRYVGIPVGLWNFIGLVLVLFVYDDPAKNRKIDKKKVLREVDYIGGFLSTAGMQWGTHQVSLSLSLAPSLRRSGLDVCVLLTTSSVLLG